MIAVGFFKFFCILIAKKSTFLKFLLAFMKTLSNFGDFTESHSRIYISLLRYSWSRRWCWKSQIIFEVGYGITVQNRRRLPECRNNHCEEGFSKDPKKSKCFRVRDGNWGNWSERGGRAPPPPLPAWANFSIIMECRPKKRLLPLCVNSVSCTYFQLTHRLIWAQQVEIGCQSRRCPGGQQSGQRRRFPGDTHFCREKCKYTAVAMGLRSFEHWSRSSGHCCWVSAKVSKFFRVQYRI